MQIITVLLIVLAAAAFLGGFAVLIGSERAQKFFAVVFFLLSLAFSGWSALYINTKIQMGRFYFGIAFFALVVILLITILVMYKKAKRTRAGRGLKMSAWTLLLAGGLGAVAFFLLPIFGIDVEWSAPFITAAIFVMLYFATLKYRMVLLSNKMLKLWSYIVMATAAIFAYMLLFYLIATYLFHINIAAEVIAMNLVMIIIVVIIFPIWHELNTEVDSLISTQKVDLTYVIKKLNGLATQNVKYSKLAEFLAEHLHFRHIWLIVNGRVYGTKTINMSQEQLVELSVLEPKDEKSVWLQPVGQTKKWLEQEEVVAIAELRDAKGEPFGRILVGRPLGKISFEKRDLAEIEMIINIVASVVDSRERLE